MHKLYKARNFIGLESNGKVELWKYYDPSHASTRHCLKVDGEIKAILNSEEDPFRCYEIACDLFGETKDPDEWEEE